MIKKILLLLVIAILVSGILFTGCSKTKETTTAVPTSQTVTPTTTAPTTTTPGTTTPTTTKPTTTTTPPSTLTPQTGGTLRIISGAEVTSFMVGEMYSPEDMSQRMPSIETLVRYDPVKQQVVPFLAESVIEDSAGKTVTFKLRSGVNFQDGTVCDAAAIKWNLDQEVKAPNTAPDFVDVASIIVVDSLTVKVSFNNWDNSFLREMCWDSAVISPTAYDKNGLDWARTNPCGTGPFKLVNFTRDVKKEFQKWDGYWQKGKPYLDALVINIIADPTVQLASLLKGENDVLGGVNPTDAKTIKDNASLVLQQAAQANGTYMCLAGDSANPDSPFANLGVRQAVSYAIDRESIKKYVYYDYAEVTNGLNSPQCWTYNPNVIGYKYDPAKARVVLSNAGYSGGFSAALYCRPEKYYKDMATAIQSNLADIGIKMDLQVLNPGQYGAMFFGMGWNNGMFVGGMVGDPEIGVVGRFFFSKAAGIGFSNSIIHPDEVEAAINAMMRATTNDAKKTSAWQLDSLAIDKYCMVTPLLTSAVLTAFSVKVHDPYITQGWTYAESWKAK
jgi:peptide/nickel transport system substrate-binding protein